VDSLHPYQGAGWGATADTFSLPGSAVNSPDSPVPFLTYVECLFIKAECLDKTGDEAGAKQALFDGLKASLNKFGVYTDKFYNDYVTKYTPLTGTPLYTEIMMQKYIAMFNQAESFNDFRRTNNAIGLLPNPTISAVQNVIPRRFPYSLGEKSYNTNTPTNVTLWDRVWWDVAK
jgi:hypothetical protein